MKRLIVDMDDVIADATGQFIRFYERDFGIRVTRDSLNYQDEGKGFPANYDVVRSYPLEAGFFRTMIPHEGSLDVLEKLNRKYDLFIVSAAMQFPQSLPEKQQWLQQYAPFIHWKQIVFCGSKAVVHGDFMIDDHLHNLETFNGEKFLFSAPHNLQHDRFKRLHNWNAVAEYFL